MPVVTYRGSVAELQGQKFDVPSTVPSTGMAKWIESTWREEQARSAAEAEREAREQQLLKERIETTRQQNVIDSLTSELQGMADRLEELSDRFGTAPDVQAMTEWNAASSSIYARSMELADEVSTMQATVTDLLQQASAMAEAAAVGEQLQQQALALLTNQQQMMNGSFETYSTELQRLSDSTNSALVEVQQLNTEAEESRETLRVASNIKQEAVSVAQQAAKAEVQAWQDDFLDLMSLSLRALGLTEQDLILAANTQAQVTSRATIGRETVRRFINVSRETNAALERSRGDEVIV